MAKRKNHEIVTTKKKQMIRKNPRANKKYKDTVFRMLFSNRENLLSEAFEHLEGEPNLELRVVTLNINEDHNRELMEQCKILREYAQYVAKVRNYTEKMKLDTAVECAVEECIQEGILEEFLWKNRAEVVAVSIFEYNKEEEEKKLREAEYEAGYDCGKQDGLTEGELRKAKETAAELAKLGMAIAQIANVLKTEEVVISQWLEKGTK